MPDAVQEPVLAAPGKEGEMMNLDAVVKEEFLKICEELQLSDVSLETNPESSIFSWTYALVKAGIKIPVKFTNCTVGMAMAQNHFAGRDPLQVLVRHCLLWAILEFVPEEIKMGKFSDLLQTSSLHMSLSFPQKEGAE
jgi:hypothetical protein